MGGAGLPYNLACTNRQQGLGATGGHRVCMCSGYIHVHQDPIFLPAHGHGGFWGVRAGMAVQCPVVDVLRVLAL